MDSKWRWGIIGTGRIARLFAKGLEQSHTGRLHAIGSRSEAAAASFGSDFSVSRCYGSYEDLVADPEVDVVYIATPNSLHRENAMLALEAGKPVLCEKPFTINAAEARSVIACARENDQFLMEAMWNRFFPAMVRLRELLGDGRIGEIRMIEADFGFRTDLNEEPVLFDSKMGGGSLLDVGVYGVSLASHFLGPPVEIASVASIGETGVDEQCAAVLRSEQGQLAVVKSSIVAETPQEATLIGTKGTIRIEGPFWCPQAMTLHRAEEEKVRIEMPYTGNGYQYEADEVGRCLRLEQKESELMSLEESVRVMETMDAIRAKWMKAP